MKSSNLSTGNARAVIDSKFTGFTKRPDSVYVCDKNTTGMDLLLFKLLSQAVPHGHEKLLLPILPDSNHRRIDEKGNVYYFIGQTKKHKTMFSSHLDTVHQKAIKLNPVLCNDGFIWGGKNLRKNTAKKGPAYNYDYEIVGADDKVGVYIMLKMMEAKIPGLYVFHVGEEAGCVGSHYAAEHQKELFVNIDRCIAFDRRGYTSVITKQRGQKCCSPEFGEALAKQLTTHINLPAVEFFLDPTGSITDSAQYTEIIPECTNISVGYFCSHGVLEHFDLIWLQHHLLPALLKVDWQALPTKRDCTEKDEPEYYHNGVGYQRHLNYDYYETKNLNLQTSWYKIPPIKFNYLKAVVDSSYSEYAGTQGIKTMLVKALAEDGLPVLAKTIYGLFKDLVKITEEKTILEKEVKELTEANSRVLKTPEELHGWAEELYVQEILRLRDKLDKKEDTLANIQDKV